MHLKLCRTILKRMRIFSPIIAGAALQLMAVILITAILYVSARYGILNAKWPLPLCGASSCYSASLLIRLSYLLTAVGVALTDNDIVLRTQKFIQISSERPNEDAASTQAVTVQLSIVAIGVAIAELTRSPAVAATIAHWTHRMWVGAIVPPALWSIALAGLGSLIHATYRAVPRWDL